MYIMEGKTRAGGAKQCSKFRNVSNFANIFDSCHHDSNKINVGAIYFLTTGYSEGVPDR